MMQVHQSFSDNEKQRITEKVEELATFEAGDRVTSEPLDMDFGYHGREFEGVLLYVKGTTWTPSVLSRVDERFRARDCFDPERVVEMDDAKDVQVNDVEYTFQNFDHRARSDSLIPWDEYRAEHDRIHLEPHRDGKYNYVIEIEDEPCPVCNCIHHNFSGHDVGNETCAACGHEFSWWD